MVEIRLYVDHESDALHLRVGDVPILESEEVAHGVVLDYSEAGHVVGIEVLGLSRRSGERTEPGGTRA